MVETVTTGLSVEEYIRLARDVEAQLKSRVPFFSGLYTRVAGIRVDGPLINDRGEIWIPPPRDALDETHVSGYPVSSVIDSWLRHENAHMVYFPFIFYITPFLAVFRGFTREYGLPVNELVLSEVNNIVSDILVDVSLASLSVAGSRPEIRRYYVLKYYRKLLGLLASRRPLLEANPVGALFALYVNLYARGAIRNGAMPSELAFENPEYPSELVFNRLMWIVGEADMEKFYEVVASGRLTLLLARVLRGGVFQRAVQFSGALRSAIETLGEGVPEKLDQSLRPVAGGPEGALEMHLRVVLGLYHYYVTVRSVSTGKGNTRCTVAPLSLLSSLAYKSDAKVELVDLVGDAELLDALYQELEELEDRFLSGRREKVRLMSSRLVRAVALKFVRSGLAVAGGASPFARAVRRRTRVPWYRRPSGRIVPSSLARSKSPLDWTVRARGRGLPSGVEGAGRAPENVTIIIDESGSVMGYTGILRPFTGFDVPVYDVERVVALGVLLRTLEVGNPPTALYRFSSSYTREEYDAAGAARRLETIREDELYRHGTNLSEPLADAVERHKDGPLNYLVILTDMELSQEDARTVRRLLSGIRRSPVLIAVAGTSVPEEIIELDDRANIAVALLEERAGPDNLVTALAKLFSYTRRVVDDGW